MGLIHFGTLLSLTHSPRSLRHDGAPIDTPSLRFQVARDGVKREVTQSMTLTCYCVAELTPFACCRHDAHATSTQLQALRFVVLTLGSD